ncbi:MAG: prepilin-type N-terminal cleavage/methylation domain-containing protein [Candidatus Paceibacterota bacterium]
MKGFTLTETIVSIAIFTLIMAGAAAAIVSAYQSQTANREQAVAIEEARRGIKTMVKEIRESASGEDGSYPIEKAGDKEFIFYSDVDQDLKVEKVRYFLGSAGSDSKTKDCVSYETGGSCNVNFNGFLEGDLTEAEVKVSVEGDLGHPKECVDIYADGNLLGEVCKSQCSDCSGSWEGVSTFDVSSLASDDNIQFEADATGWVDDFCDWEYENHSIRAKFVLSWTEENISQGKGKFKKTVTNYSDNPPGYNGASTTEIISSYVRNSPPIFKYYYFDEEKEELVQVEDYPARLEDTELMKVYLVVDVNPGAKPEPFELSSYSQLRNL